MLRWTIVAVELLVATPVWAGTLTVSLTVGGKTQTASVTMPDGDIGRILAAEKAIETAKTKIKAGEAPPVLSDQAILQTILGEVVKSLSRNTLGYERGQAAQKAMENVVPIAVPK